MAPMWIINTSAWCTWWSKNVGVVHDEIIHAQGPAMNSSRYLLLLLALCILIHLKRWLVINLHGASRHILFGNSGCSRWPNVWMKFRVFWRVKGHGLRLWVSKYSFRIWLLENCPRIWVSNSWTKMFWSIFTSKISWSFWHALMNFYLCWFWTRGLYSCCLCLIRSSVHVVINLH